jgi:hypothetical protein
MLAACLHKIEIGEMREVDIHQPGIVARKPRLIVKSRASEKLNLTVPNPGVSLTII